MMVLTMSLGGCVGLEVAKLGVSTAGLYMTHATRERVIALECDGRYEDWDPNDAELVALTSEHKRVILRNKKNHRDCD